LENIVLNEVSQDQKHKRRMFSDFLLCICWSIDKQKHAWSYINSIVEHVCNSGTTLWNLGKERKEKRMTEHQ
jgi:hypothetical protein